MADKDKKSAVMHHIGGLRFHVYYAGKLQKTVTLAQDCIFLGRLLTCHLPVEDPKVSRMHTVIELRGGKEVALTDLGSSNGTLVNGKKEKEIALADGDTIEIGDSRIKVEFLSAERVANMPAVIHHSGISRGIGSQQVGVETVMLESPQAQAAVQEEMQLADNEIDAILSGLEPAVVRQPDAGKAIGKIGDKGSATKTVVSKKSAKAAATTLIEDVPTPAKTRAPVKLDKTKQAQALRMVRSSGTALELKVQWGEEILDVHHFNQPTTITVGTHRRNTYIIPPADDAPASISLIAPQEKESSHYHLGFTDGMEGWVYTSDKLHSLAELKKSPRVRASKQHGDKLYILPLTNNDKGMISIENLAFCFQTVRSFPVYHSPVNKVDRRPFWIGTLLYLLLILFALFAPAPVPEVTVAEQVQETVKAYEVMYNRERARSVLDSMVSKELREIGSPKGDARGKATMGDQQKGNLQDKKVGGEEGARSKGAPRRVADSNAAKGGETLAKALNALKSDDISKLLGKSGFKAQGGGMATTSADTGLGSASRLFATLGSSLKATGDGAGGVGGAGGGTSVDIGGLGTKGKGSGAGGYGTVRLGEKLEASVEGGEEGYDVRGGLDRELIRRVVERNKGQIQFCYDTKLQLNKGGGKPNGRVAIRWTISPSGRVIETSKASSTMNDAAFEQCLMDRIRTWIFPEPKGGGIVKVEYPFVFRPAG